MSTRQRCKSCGGTYETVTADGGTYTHACPPVVASVTVQRGAAVVTVAPRELVLGDVELARQYVERRDRRDENHPGRGAPAGAIRAEGLGVETL